MSDEYLKSIAETLQGWKKTELREGDVLILGIPNSHLTFPNLMRGIREIDRALRSEGITAIFVHEDWTPYVVKREDL